MTTTAAPETGVGETVVVGIVGAMAAAAMAEAAAATSSPDSSRAERANISYGYLPRVEMLARTY
jgi:hypothetical protein